MTPVLTTILLLVATVLANMGPPKPAKSIGSTVLTDCGCDAFVANVQKCQQLPATDFDGAETCICDRDWYSSGMACRDCILVADGTRTPFYDGLTQAITNVFVACTNIGGSVKVAGDGEPGVCGWTVGGWACVGFDAESGEAWSSEEDRETKEVVVGRAEVDVKPVSVASKAVSSVSAASKPTDSASTPTATKESASSSADASSASTTEESADASSAPTAEESADASSVPTTDPNAATDVKRDLGSSLALAGIVVLLVAMF